jgi:hypothetical protein
MESPNQLQISEWRGGIEERISVIMNSIREDIVECKRVCTADFRAGSEIDFQFAELVHDFNAVMDEKEKYAEEALSLSEHFQAKFLEADSKVVLLLEENEWLRSQADNALIQADFSVTSPSLSSGNHRCSICSYCRCSEIKSLEKQTAQATERLLSLEAEIGSWRDDLDRAWEEKEILAVNQRQWSAAIADLKLGELAKQDIVKSMEDPSSALNTHDPKGNSRLRSFICGMQRR